MSNLGTYTARAVSRDVADELLARPARSHVVQFYDDDHRLEVAVAGYLHAGLGTGDPVAVIATPAHREAFTRELTSLGVDFSALERAGRVVFLDARETLETFMRNGEPDAVLFEKHVGGVIAQLLARHPGASVRAYGEMVDLLWREGNTRGALELERLWNELGRKAQFSLFCAYVMGGFFTEQAANGFHAICDAHSHVLAVPDVALIERARLLESEVAKRKQLELALREALDARGAAQEQLESLYRITGALHAELEIEKVVQRLTDEATAVCRAQFGAFFYNLTSETGESYTLYTLAGVEREHFATFPMPRNTAVFGPTFRGEGVVRIDDVTKDPRYGKSAPHHGMPKGHLPVCSYLAVPVIARDGNVLGGLFFGHPSPGVFTARDEALVGAVAAQAAVAIENARLYEEQKRSAATQRRAAEVAEQSRARTANLHRLAVELSRALDVEGAIRTVLRETHAVIDADASAVFLLDESGEQIERFVGDGRADAELARSSTRIETPILFETRALGTLAFLRERPLSDEEREFLLVVGRQCGQAIERVRLHEATQAARAQAEQANRAKDDFLAMLGHELRNPLSPILTAVQLMRLRGESTSAREQDVIERQVNHLIHIVDDLLDISRIARGKVVLEQAPVGLRAVIARAIETVMPLIEQRRHRLEVVHDTEDAALFADELRLCQVFTNILTNAAKYTPPGGHIRLSTERAGDHLRVRVRDNGIGIAPALLPRVFELFIQGMRDVDRAQGGLGIGLSLVHNLVTMHGGTVTAHSDGVGKGCEMVVELPAFAAAPESTHSEPERPLTTAPRPRRVLIVDDNQDVASLMGEMLGAMGHEVVVVNDGASALALAERFRPEIGVLDIGLPGMDGYTLATALRGQLGDGVYLMAVTGYGQPADRIRAERAGFDVHYVKPVSLSVVSAAIDARP